MQVRGRLANISSKLLQLPGDSPQCPGNMCDTCQSRQLDHNLDKPIYVIGYEPKRFQRDRHQQSQIDGKIGEQSENRSVLFTARARYY